MPRAVLDMMDRRPIWAMPSWVPKEIRSSLPEEWELVVIDELTDGSGDGATPITRPMSPAILEVTAKADLYFGYGVPAELLEAAPGLRWVHSGAAGVGSSLTQPMLERDVIFTNSARVHAKPMAETVLAMILYFGRGLDLAVANQKKSIWDTEPYYTEGAPLNELSELTVGVLGFGGVGYEVSLRVASLGARVVALKRTSLLEDEDVVPAAEGVLAGTLELLSGDEGFRTCLAQSDVLVLAVPDTPETRGMMDREAFSWMKQGAVLINVARGKLIDEEALIDALNTGKLRGAALDVFQKEPLRGDHELWDHSKVLITPHVSAVSRGFWRRETDLILHNLQCYLEGYPLKEWRNVVNKAAGY